MAILTTAIRKSGKAGMFLINRDEIERAIENFRHMTEEKMESAIERLGNQAVSFVQDKTPVQHGDLKASIHLGPITKSDGAFRADVTTSQGYAQAVEFGVKGRTYHYNVAGIGDVVGVGAGMFRKTYDSRHDNDFLEKILLDELRK